MQAVELSCPAGVIQVQSPAPSDVLLIRVPGTRFTFWLPLARVGRVGSLFERARSHIGFTRAGARSLFEGGEAQVGFAGPVALFF